MIDGCLCPLARNDCPTHGIRTTGTTVDHLPRCHCNRPLGADYVGRPWSLRCGKCGCTSTDGMDRATVPEGCRLKQHVMGRRAG